MIDEKQRRRMNRSVVNSLDADLTDERQQLTGQRSSTDRHPPTGHRGTRRGHKMEKLCRQEGNRILYLGLGLEPSEEGTEEFY
ncbi:unnamed protein product [Heligmosomoides polygyrus]|uniref:Transposase n=1 Tax=Heligmosomoides polygyrus TaxID=6339 RepID=A0A183FMP6_HELPZ|nr:unnamed protein product [Heligmosomoides polygyrus]